MLTDFELEEGVAALDGVALHYVMDKSKFDTKKLCKDFMDSLSKILLEK